MAKSNKPIIWGVFAAGGTVSAFVIPVLVLVTLLASFGYVADALSFDTMHAFAANWFGKLILFFVIFLALWHAAHRFRITVHDFGVRADGLVATVAYVLAAIGTVLCLVYLFRI